MSYLGGWLAVTHPASVVLYLGGGHPASVVLYLGGGHPASRAGQPGPLRSDT